MQTRKNEREAGFTMLELLVVLVILGLLAALAGPRVLNYLAGAKSDAARIQIERLAGTLDLYRLEVGQYPNQEQGLRALVEAPAGAQRWNGPYLTKSDGIMDPWGRPYAYRTPGRNGAPFEIYSLGADGREGGDGEDRDVVAGR
jgi:general secretion pathway protein G